MPGAYYVATNGNNGWPGTLAQPWRDIQYGYDNVPSAGDTLFIRGGTYTEGLIEIDNNGTSSLSRIVRAYAGPSGEGTPETVIIKNRIEVSGQWNDLRDLEFVTNNTSPSWQHSEITVFSSNNSFLRMYCHDYNADLYGSGIMLSVNANYNTFLDTRLIWSGSIYFRDLQASNNLFLGGEIAYSEGMSLRIGGANNTVDGFALHDTGQVGLDGDAGDGVHFHGNGHSLKNCQLYRNFRWEPSQHCDAIQWWTNATNPTVNDILIENCRIGSTERGGVANEEDMGHIQWTAEDTSSDRVTVRNCVFLGTGYPYCFSTSTAQVTRANDWVITGNILRCPEGIRDNGNAHNWTIRNNVFYQNGTYFTNFYDIDYNVYVNSNENPDEGTHSHEVSDAGFEDDNTTGAGQGYGQWCDWHLVAGSVCIDAGDSDEMPTLDPDGNSRWDDPSEANIGTGSGGAYWDIAIYERQGEGGQIETLQGSSAGTSTAGANVYVAGIQEMAGQSDGSSTASATVEKVGQEVLAGQSNGVATVGASLQVTGSGGQLYATLEDDVFINASAKTTNHGTWDSLYVYRPVTDTDWCRLSILRFHFTNIPDESVITVADLGLFAWEDPTSGVTIYARHLESTGQAFTELGATWNTYNGSSAWDSGEFSAADWTTVNQASDVTTGVDQHWMNFDIVAMVQHALDNHAKVLEIVITNDVGDSYFDFNSKDYGEDIPYLDITYTGGGPIYKELAGQSDGGSTAGLNLEKCVAFRYPESDDAETDGVFTYIPSSPETVWDKVDDDWNEWDGDATRVRHDSPDDSCYAGDSTAFAIPANATIVDLRIKLAHKKAQAGVAAISTSIKVGGTWYDSDPVDPVLDTYTNQYTDYANNPDTSNPWTVDQINGVGGNALDTFGWLCPDTDPDIHITQCVLRCRYTFDLGQTKEVAGASDGVATVSGTVSPIRGLDGASNGGSTVVGSLKVTKKLTTSVFNNILTDNQASVETDLVGIGIMGGSGATNYRDTNEFLFGIACLKTVTDNIASGEGWVTQSRNVEASYTYTGSIWLMGLGTVKLHIYERNEADGFIGAASSEPIILTNKWTRYEISKVFGPLGVKTRILVVTHGQQGITYYTDGLQIEQGATASKWHLPSEGLPSSGDSTASASIELGNEKLLAGQANGVSTVTGSLSITKSLGGQTDGSSTAIVVRLEDASRNLADTSELFRTW